MEKPRKKFSEETKQKMRLAKLGKPLSEIHRQHLSDSKKGRLITPMTPEIIEKIRIAKTGVPNPKTSIGLKKGYAEGKYTNWIKGKTYEEIYGKEKADIIKKNMGKQNIGKIPWIKGKNKETESKIMEYSMDNTEEGNHMFGKHLSEETKRKIGEIKKIQSKGVLNGMYGKRFPIELYPNYGIRKIRKDLILPMRNTSIELKVQDYLKQLQIGFFTHYYCSEITHAYQCDIMIPVQRNRDRFIRQPIIIECDGDYWHCNPKKYSTPINKMQEEQVEEDKIRTQELEEKGFIVIRLWERDIKIMQLNEFNNICLNKIGATK